MNRNAALVLTLALALLPAACCSRRGPGRNPSYFAETTSARMAFDARRLGDTIGSAPCALVRSVQEFPGHVAGTAELSCGH